MRYITTFIVALRNIAPTRKAIWLAMLAGTVAGLAMPPFGLWPVLLVTLPVLYYLLDNQTTGRAFWRGWAYSFGFLVAGLYWIAEAMMVDIASFWWAIPLSVAGLPLYLALYTGLAGSFYAWLQRRYAPPPAARILLLAILMMVAETARGVIFTGFPWNMLGQTWDRMLPMLQSASLFGVHGLSLLTYMIMLLPVLLLDNTHKRQSRALAGVIAVIAIGLYGWGTARVAQAPMDIVENVSLRIVQPNIAQSLKWDPEARMRNFEHTMNMAATPAGRNSTLKPTHIILPEAAVPFYLDQVEEARLEIAARTPAGGLMLLGAPWRSFTAEGGKTFSNAMVTVNDVGAIQTRYDKHHLVPFGEYFPLRKQLEALIGSGLNAVAAGAYDFTPGPGPQTLKLMGLPPVSPLICYEVIFSGEVTSPAERPAWLLNLTNDAWFGSSTGPYQHFAIARMRAIEEGLPLVRAANTGISGVIDAYGRVRSQTNINETVALDVGLPVAASPTIFGCTKHLPYLGMMIISLITAAFLSLRRRKPA